jgi:hypothetical protein
VKKSPGNSDTASYMSLRQAVRLSQHSRQESNLLLHLWWRSTDEK